MSSDTDTLTSDFEQARRFIRILTGSTPVTFQTYSDKDSLKVKKPDGKTYDPNAKILHGTLEQHAHTLTTLNRRGAGVYVCVNQTDGNGRKAENVTGVRALFIDTDGAPYPQNLPLRPHIVVRSSPKRWHIYWCVSDVPLTAFRITQKALAVRYGTDTAVCDLPRVMRLPSFYHCKQDPVMVDLLGVSNHPHYSFSEVKTAWPCITEALAASQQKQQPRQTLSHNNGLTTDTHTRRVRSLLQGHHDAVAAAPEGQRHSTLIASARALGGYVTGEGVPESDVIDALTAAAAVCGLSECEALEAIKWAVNVGKNDPLTLDKTVTVRADPTRPQSRRARQIARIKRAVRHD